MSDYRDEQLRELKSDLERYEAELLPGAIDRMLTLPMWQALARIGDPGMRARRIHEAVHGVHGLAYRVLAGDAPSDKPRDTLKAVIARYSDLLRPGAVGALYDALALDWSRRGEPEVVEHVARVLADPKSNVFLRDPLPPSPGVSRVLDALAPWRHQLKSGADVVLAERWGDLHDDLEARRLESRVAMRLKTGFFDQHLRRLPFDPSDRRGTAQAERESGPTRRDDGAARDSFAPRVRL